MSVETPAAETCIRRWYATYTTCTCTNCRKITKRVVAQISLGRQVRVPSDAGWRVLKRMFAAGWSDTAIASACNLPLGTVHSIVRDYRDGFQRTLSAGVTERILRHGQPTRGFIGHIGSQRKLRALARIGHSLQDISDVSGLPASTLSPCRRGSTIRISPAAAEGIDQAWRALCMKPGTCARSRLLAIRMEWPGPLAYDDIDNPDETPSGVERITTRAERRAEARRLAVEGLSPERIADQIGIAVTTVRRALRKEAA
jgi:hypothetical protein